MPLNHRKALIVKKDVTVVATGYLAPLMFDECRSLTDHHPHLTLEGLRLVHERSKANPRRGK